jgi:PAS domain S-box-containing protein
MAVGTKKPDEENTVTSGIERTLRDGAEEQLARSPKHYPGLTGQSPEQLIHELQVHQIELETQAEELIKAKLAFEESRDKYLDLYDFAPLGYLRLTDKGLIAEANLSCATLLGVQRGNLVRASFSKFMSEKDSDQWYRHLVNVLKHGEKQTCTLTLTRGDGSIFPARLESIRLTSSEGAITVRTAISDITDIWQIEALKESEERYRRITEELTDYLYTVTVQDGKVVNTTHGAACSAVTGYTAEEFSADPYLWIRMVFDKDRDRVVRHFSGVLSGKPVPPVEHRIVRKDGQIRWVRDTPLLLLDAAGRLVSYDGVIKDITERKVAEEDIQFKNVILLTQQETSLDSILLVDENGKILSFNRNFIELWSIPDDVIASRSDDRALQYVGDKLADPELFLSKVNYLYIHREEKSHDEILLKDGRILDRYSAPMIGQDKKYYGRVWYFRDITERKRAEDALLRVNQKLNILSQLTRKDLTNQIFVLNSYLEMAKKQVAGQDQVITTLQKGVHAIQSLHETIEYSKDYQDMGAKLPKWQNVKMAMLYGLSHISISNIQHCLETENLEIYADPLLEKVCQRLFENSVKHGDHVTRIRVWHTVTPEGVTIIFEDDGIGIPQKLKEQIFLRRKGPRASMRSLIFVREILDITGITIKETGEPGKGARFEMTVPKGAWRSVRKVN